MAGPTAVAPGTDYRWPDGGTPPSADTYLLAHFAAARLRGRTLDLCSGAGLAALLLARRVPAADFVCADLSEEAVRLCTENAARAGLGGRIASVRCDLRRIEETFAPESFSSAVCNPPYHAAGTGALSAAAASARAETSCTLGQVCAAAARMLQNGGRFFVCMKAVRTAELLWELRAAGLEPKRLRLAAHTAERAPFLALCEGKKGAAPGIEVLPQLALFSRDGRPTAESDEIYFESGEENG